MAETDHSISITNGPAWAAILAAGIGCAALGLFIDLGEASKRISNLLNFYDPVGNLSGKSTFAVLVWLIAWIVLHLRWRNRTITSTASIATITLILIILGIAASCPLVFGLFSAT